MGHFVRESRSLSGVGEGGLIDGFAQPEGSSLFEQVEHRAQGLDFALTTSFHTSGGM
jgi:hypothetical protein